MILRKCSKINTIITTSQYYFRVVFDDPTLNPSPKREGLTPLPFLGRGPGGGVCQGVGGGIAFIL